MSKKSDDQEKNYYDIMRMFHISDIVLETVPDYENIETLKRNANFFPKEGNIQGALLKPKHTLFNLIIVPDKSKSRAENLSSLKKEKLAFVITDLINNSKNEKTSTSTKKEEERILQLLVGGRLYLYITERFEKDFEVVAAGYMK